MSEEKKNLSVEENVASDSAADKKSAKANKKPNIFVRIWKKLCKLFKDVVGEMKKVVWTPKDELKKSTKLVLVTVLIVGLAIAVTDTCFSWLINSFAGIIG